MGVRAMRRRAGAAGQQRPHGPLEEVGADGEEGVGVVEVRVVELGLGLARAEAEEDAGAADGEAAEVLGPAEGVVEFDDREAGGAGGVADHADGGRIAAGGGEVLVPGDGGGQACFVGQAACLALGGGGEGGQVLIGLGADDGVEQPIAGGDAEGVLDAGAGVGDGDEAEAGGEGGPGHAGEAVDHGGQGGGGAEAVAGVGRVGGAALQVHGHAARGATEDALTEDDGAGVVAREVVQGDGDVRLDLRPAGVGEHAGGPGAGLFGGLEEQDDAPPGRWAAVEAVGQGGDRGGVPVVAAGVHHAGDGGGVRGAGALVDRQGVEFGPHEDGRAGGAGIEDSGQAGAAGGRGEVLEQAGGAGAGDEVADGVVGAVLSARHLRVRVQGAAQGGRGVGHGQGYGGNVRGPAHGRQGAALRASQSSYQLGLVPWPVRIQRVSRAHS